MTKTPFEIRFDLLAMAKDHLLQKFYSEMDIAKETKSEYPQYPTNEEIFALAESFKDFIDKK